MKKFFGKLTAAVLAMLMALTSVPGVLAAEDASVWTAKDKTGVAARFAVISDSHLIKDTSRLDLAFQSFTNVGGVDALMMVGDIVYMEDKDKLYPERYDLLNSTMAKYNAIDKIPLAYAMGNHEFPQGTTDATISANSVALFNEKMAAKTGGTENYTLTVNGYTIVVAAPEAYSNKMTAATEAWIQEQITAAKEANPGKPVFYLQHQPIQNTVYSSSSSVNSSDFITWIKSQTGVINLTAHCHYTSWDPRSIWQSESGFTAIHNAVLGGGYMNTQSCDYERSNITDSAHALLLDVNTDNTVTVYRMDLYNGEYVGDPYVIDMNNLYYTDARYEQAQAPVWNEGAGLTLDSTDGHNITVTFDADATMTESGEKMHDGFVHRWRVEAVNKDTGLVSKYKTMYGDFWTKKVQATRTVTLSDLIRSTDYTVNVYPVSAFGKMGEPLTIDASTTREKTETDKALSSTKLLNVAANKKVYANDVSLSWPVSILTDSNLDNFTVPDMTGENQILPEGYTGSTNWVNNTDGWIMIDLEKRYVIESVELYDRRGTDQNGGRMYFEIQASNDMNFASYDVLDKMDAENSSIFPFEGCFETEGNGKAYRYVRIKKTSNQYYAYSEIKIFAKQDVTEVSRFKNTVVDNQYSSSYSGAKAVNGTVTNDADAWVSEQGGKYHFLRVDLEKPYHIGLIEMAGRSMPLTNSTTPTYTQRNFWYVSGSNAELAEDETEYISTNSLYGSANIYKDNYTKLLYTGNAADYKSCPYIFPEYRPNASILQQTVSDKNAYRFITFSRGGNEVAKGSTYLGEVRAFELNPMVNSVDEENGIITAEFSDVMNAASMTSENVKVLSGENGSEIAAAYSLSDDGYTLTITPETTASYYSVVFSDAIVNTNGTELANEYTAITTPENIYGSFDVKKDIYANVAMGKPVTSSGLSIYQNPNGNYYPAYFLTDGFIGSTSSANVDKKIGTTLGTGKGYLQVDLQNRYNLEKIELSIRQNASANSYIKNLKILASNDATFAAGTYDTLDAITSVDYTKLRRSGSSCACCEACTSSPACACECETCKCAGWSENANEWVINLDGTKSYRYLRVEKTANEGEWGFAELKAWAKFDAISLTKNATADSYYRYGKGQAHEASYLPQKVLDGNINTFHVVFNGDGVKPKNEKYTYLQVDLKKPYHVGYAELVSRVGGYSGAGYYQQFDIIGSNIGDSVTDDEVDTHPYLNTKWLESVEGYTALYRTMGYGSLGSLDDIWEKAEGKTYQMSLNDAEAYQYITHKTNSEQVGCEISEFRLYSIAQKVNKAELSASNKVTLNFAGQLMPSTVSTDTIKLLDKNGAELAVNSVVADDYSVTLTAAEDIPYGAQISVSENVMNLYAVPMAGDYTAVVREEPAEGLSNVTFDGGDAIAASTTYTFTADYYGSESKALDVYVAVKAGGKLVKITKAATVNTVAGVFTPVTGTITTDEDVEGQTIEVYVWDTALCPIESFDYFETVTDTGETEAE